MNFSKSYKRVFSLLLLVLAVLTGVLFVVQQLQAAQEVTQSPQSGLSQPVDSFVTLTGQLTVLWGDGLPGTDPIPPIYRLTTVDGFTYQIQFSDSHPSSLMLAAQEVTVYGRFLSTYSPFGEGLFLATAVQTAQSTLDPIGDNNDVVGPQPWISVMCKFADYPYESRDLAYFQAMYSLEYPGLDHYWREASYETITLEGSTAVGWYTLPYTRGHYMDDLDFPNLNALFDDCVAVADPDVDYTQFSGINLMFNEPFGAYAFGTQNYTTLDGESRLWSNTWIPPWGYEELTVMAHEMGHGLGLYHSLDPYGYEYGNEWDVMSNMWGNCERLTHPIYGCLGQHPMSYQKELLGWIPPERQETVIQGASETITIERLALPQSNNPLMVKIRLGASSSTSFFTVEARRQNGYDYKLPTQAVVIHQVGPYSSWSQQVLSGTLFVGDTYVDPAGQITVAVTAETDTGFVVDIDYALFSCEQQSDIPLSECEALLTFYNAMNGDEWLNNSGWFYGSPCNWHGPTCEGGHIISLNYYSNNLSGTLPTKLTNLTYLNALYLQGNPLGGPIPTFLTDLPNLQWLNLTDNHFSGPIPPELGEIETLNALFLNGNQLTGTIPAELANLPALLSLDLQNNHLSGPIPPELGNMTSLFYLSLAGNQLEGNLPTTLANLSMLTLMDLSRNQLTGTIPAEFGNLTGLHTLFLAENQLTGHIPPELESMPNLRDLSLAGNQLTGEVPDFSDAPQLWALNLSGNQLTGTIPISLPAILSTLILSDNELTGKISADMLSSHNFFYLDLSQNHLEGAIPPELSHSPFLYHLDLSQNRLTGTIPVELGEIGFPLQYLDLSDNQLHGPIPTSLTYLTGTQSLDIGYNALSANQPDLLAFLQLHDPDWLETQTVPPTAVRVTELYSTSIQLTWQPIFYLTDGGYYEVSIATSPNGPFTVHGITADKAATGYLAESLQPDMVYYFLVRTFTPAHDGQQNDLWSDYSNLALTPVGQAYLPVVSMSSGTGGHLR